MRMAAVCIVTFTEMMTNQMNLRTRPLSEIRSSVKAKLVLLHAAERVEKLPDKLRVKRRSAKVALGKS